MVVTETLGEDQMGTKMVAILGTTSVAIPTGMITYGLDIVVKFDAVCYFLWRDQSTPLKK
jgi:hypothetical protein